ncbi:UPF0182 family protein [Natranaerobius trueperi]|nr:UPF0182 family protein [Natranaerobius trueperi]
MWKKYRFYILTGLFIFILLSIRQISVILTDIQWFSNLGFSQLFWRPIGLQFGFSLIIFLVGASFIFYNLRIASKNLITLEEESRFFETSFAPYADLVRSIGKLGQGLIAIILSFIWTGSFSNLWQELVYFFGGTSTGMSDPIYNFDLSFYLFRLPLFQRIVTNLLGLVIVTTIIIGLLYVARGTISFYVLKRGLNVSKNNSLKHLNLLLGVTFLLLSFNFFLSLFELLFSDQGVVFGMGYTDTYISRPVYILLAIFALASFLLSLANIKWKKYRWSIICLIGIMVLSILGSVTASVFQSVFVSPNELTREAPFIEHHLEMTQKAYGIDEISEQTWQVVDEETSPELTSEVKDNVRLLDYRPLRDVYREEQEYRRYYQFNDVDMGRYTVNDTYHQVMLSARELDVDLLPEGAQTSVNRHLKYTHGYGLAMSPVGDLTPNGLPNYFFRDMPIKDQIGISLDRPEIYFGELTNDFVLVNSDESEFNYPGQEDIDHTYEGEDGINMNLMNRILFSLRKANSFLLFSQEYSSDSQILFDRNIIDRVEKIAPFFRYDSDPYLAVADEKLYWIIDAYVETDNFPYSQPFEDNKNYIENPVKVVIDAYSGSVDFYLVKDDDPFSQALDRFFPELFTDLDQASNELREQFRYPEDLFSAQASILKNYHMEDPVIFYNREDAWDIPTESYRGESITMEPYYATLDLPNSEGPEFVLMIPYTPVERNNMISWLGARNDGENYGELVLYRFPRGEHLRGPQQIESRIDQDDHISQQISLWDTRGSNVIRGNLLVIPLDNGILYIEPLFLQAEESSYPEMRRVIASWQGKVVMTNTIDEALIAFGADPEELDIEDPEDIEEDFEEIPDPELGDVDELVQEALEIYQQADQALRVGEWSEYGKAIEELESILQEMQSQVEQ